MKGRGEEEKLVDQGEDGKTRYNSWKGTSLRLFKKMKKTKIMQFSCVKSYFGFFLPWVIFL